MIPVGPRATLELPDPTQFQLTVAAAAPAQQHPAGTSALAEGGAGHLGPHPARSHERHELQSIPGAPPQQPGELRAAKQATVAAHHLPGQTPQAIVAPEAEAHRIGEGGKGKLACSPQLELPARRQLPEGSELGADGPGLVGNNAEEVELLKLGCRANCTDALQAIKAGVEGQRARRPVVPQAEAGEARAQPALIATTNDDGDAFTT